MTNLRDEWQKDVAAAANSSFFTATVTAVNGDGTVTFKRYPDATAETQPKLASYTSPLVGDVVSVQAIGTGWLVIGLVNPIYQPIAVVTSLPTASATYRGVALRVQGGTGVADGVYICEKTAADTYSWIAMDSVAPSNPYGILGTATMGSSTSFTTSEAAISGLSVTATPPGTGYVRATIIMDIKEGLTNGNGRAQFKLKEDSTVIRTFTFQFPLNDYTTVTWQAVFTSTNASHTYTVTAQDLSSVSGNINSGGKLVIEAVAP